MLNWVEHEKSFITSGLVEKGGKNETAELFPLVVILFTLCYEIFCIFIMIEQQEFLTQGRWKKNRSRLCWHNFLHA